MKDQRSLEQKVTDLQAAIESKDDAKADLSPQNEKIDALQTSLEELEARVTELESAPQHKGHKKGS